MLDILWDVYEWFPVIFSYFCVSISVHFGLEDVLKRNEANAKHYWYWYGTQRATLMSTRIESVFGEMSTTVTNIQLQCSSEPHEVFASFSPGSLKCYQKPATKSTGWEWVKKNHPKPQADRLNFSLTLITTHLSYFELILAISSEEISFLTFPFRHHLLAHLCAVFISKALCSPAICSCCLGQFPNASFLSVSCPFNGQEIG